MQPSPGRCPQKIDGEFSARKKTNVSPGRLWGKKKRAIRHVTEKKCNEVNWCRASSSGTRRLSRVSLSNARRKKSLTKETRISVLAMVEKKKSRFNFFYLAFYLDWNCDSKHNKLPRLVFLPFTSDMYTLTC